MFVARAQLRRESTGTDDSRTWFELSTLPRRWTSYNLFEREKPDVGGGLYGCKTPSGCTRAAVVRVRRWSSEGPTTNELLERGELWAGFSYRKFTLLRVGKFI